MFSFKLVDGPSGGPGPTSSFSSTRERDFKRRRAQGEAACAECRRLRLKCDKKLPCSSCIRRGYSDLCPNEALKTGRALKFIPDQVYDKITQMSKRIRQLEDALEIAQAALSSLPHALLSNELRKIKNIVDVPEETNVKDSKITDDAEANFFSEFGTLSISDQGETQLYGRSGAAAYMVHSSETPAHSLRKSLQSKLPTEIVYFSEIFPFSPVYIPKDEIIQLIEARMPSYERATALAEIYVQHVSPHFGPVDREQIMEELIPMFYKKDKQRGIENEAVTVAHRLALLTAIFACGAMGDMTQEACNEEGELYRQLSRSALSLQSIFEGTSLATIQTISLLGLYEFFNCSIHTLDAAWKMQALSFSLASSIGLHLDPSKWGIDLKYVNRRRRLFWELCKVDSLKSLGSGRPAVFRMQEVACRYPEDKNGAPIWLYKYIRDIVSPAAAKLCSVNATKYSEIIEWDRWIREFNPPQSAHRSHEDLTTETFMFTLLRAITLLFIHRNFFVRAFRESPTNPMQSRFAPSFLTVYSSAVTVLEVMRHKYIGQAFLLRQWPLWVNVISAGLVVGLVAVHDSPMEQALSARKELDFAINLFEKAPDHPVLRHCLPILLRLRERSQMFESVHQNQKPDTVDAPEIRVKTEDIEQALSAIGGENRVVRAVDHGDNDLLRIKTPSPLKPLNDGTLYGQHEFISPLSVASKDSSFPNPIPRDRSQLQALVPGTPTIPKTVQLSAYGGMCGTTSPSQLLEGMMPSQVHNPAPIYNTHSDMPNHESSAPTGVSQERELSGTALNGWDTESWPSMDWNNLDIPTNFDFDIDSSILPPSSGGDNVIQDAWNMLLDEAQLKYGSNGLFEF